MFERLANQRLAEGFHVEDTPTVKIFRQALAIDEVIRYRPLKKLVEELESILHHERCQR